MKPRFTRRSQLEIYVDILNAVLITDIPTRILSLANVQYNHFLVKLDRLERFGFVTVTGEKHKAITVTSKGEAWLREISEALELVTHEHE